MQEVGSGAEKGREEPSLLMESRPQVFLGLKCTKEGQTLDSPRLAALSRGCFGGARVCVGARTGALYAPARATDPDPRSRSPPVQPLPVTPGYSQLHGDKAGHPPPLQPPCRSLSSSLFWLAPVSPLHSPQISTVGFVVYLPSWGSGQLSPVTELWAGRPVHPRANGVPRHQPGLSRALLLLLCQRRQAQRGSWGDSPPGHWGMQGGEPRDPLRAGNPPGCPHDCGEAKQISFFYICWF